MHKMDDTPEKYVISMAKKYLDKDKYMAKAWLLTATTLFRNNFAVQFEAYEMEKEANNYKEAAKCLRNLFRQFPTNERLWQEIQLLVAALRTEHHDEHQMFFVNMFNNLPPEVQHEMLLVTADHSEDTMEHCRLMLLLLKKFPATISQHGGRLVDLLVSAEKHEHQQAINCYRKLLVCDLLPLLGAATLELPTKQLFKLLHKSIEFYLSYVMNRTKAIQDLPPSEGIIEEPWSNLCLVLEMIGRKLNWELSTAFSWPINKELVWQKIVQFRRVYLEQPKHGQQLLYCALVLFLFCLHEYCSALDPVSGSSMVLVEGIVGDVTPSTTEPAAKVRKLETEDSLNVHWTVGDSSQNTVIPNFLLGYQCWQLLYSCDYLEREFTKLIQTLGLDPWISGFLLDMTLYQGSHEECLRILTTHEMSRKTHLRLASTHYFLGLYMPMLDHILGAVTCWPLHSMAGTLSSIAAPDKKRHLHYLPLRQIPVLQYCCRLLIQTLKLAMMHVTIECDLAMGHILVLLQLDWPQQEVLESEIFRRIQQRGSFTYALFTKYIVLPDIVDDFMLLSTQNIPLDILPPSSNQMLNHRRMSTRGVDKGAKEDFKLAMKRQVARSVEPIDTLITSFLTEQRDLISHSLSNCVT